MTLTYNDENMPLDKGLHLSDFQKFKDNLRYNSDGRKFKYYHCGEYGDKRKRPHYHVILYGFDPLNNNDREMVYESWGRCESFFFDPLPKNWRHTKSPQGKGMLPVCREDIAYTCGYVQKKLNGAKGKEEYGNKRPPYSTGSNGLGLEFALANAERLCSNRWTYLNGKKIGLPRYFRDKLGISLDDVDWSKSMNERMRDEWLYLYDEFKKKYPSVDPMSRQFEKLFNSWYDRREFDYALQIERDYLERKHLYYGIE